MSWLIIAAVVLVSLLNAALIVPYALHTLAITGAYLCTRRRAVACPPCPGPDRLPVVTVQLPLFNEGRVAERVIDAAGRLDWPADKLEIQVLDDSTDAGDRAIVDAAAERTRRRGVDVRVVRREDRSGFKAGAMAAALPEARGEYVAIFDADFLPRPDFLRLTVPRFLEPGAEDLGLVQTRWSHLNADASLLTRCQEALIDAHFVVEQTARSRCGLFMSFNGTGGVWRRTCIDDAGGWSPRTLTEDLDLSIRAQLRGWRFFYDPDVDCPAELPAALPHFKSQQRRWNKGIVEVARHTLPEIWRAPREAVGFVKKLDISLHLVRPVLQLWLVAICVLSLPIMVIDTSLSSMMVEGFFQDAVAVVEHFWLLGIAATAALLTVSALRLRKRISVTLLRLPAVFALGAGMAVSNAWAVAEALAGKVTPFVRTPKGSGTVDPAESAAPAASRKRPALRVEVLEFALAGYLLVGGLGALIMSPEAGAVPFLLILAGGCAWTGVLAHWEAIKGAVRGGPAPWQSRPRSGIGEGDEPPAVAGA